MTIVLLIHVPNFVDLELVEIAIDMKKIDLIF